jgi:cell fate regulator YaaT (PSP1 superfamily)
MEYQVVPVRFERLGKNYHFALNGVTVKKGDRVVVETVRGIEIGSVAQDPLMIQESEVVAPLKPVIRIATEQDLKQYSDNKAQEVRVMQKTAELVKKHQLEMKLLNCEFTLDRTKLIIYFTAEGRVDFRELVKEIANEFHLRIELRQVGARDGAKALGGIGPCGLITCCSTFLGEFQPVSIKMAKNQSLSLNPTNISGLCGKLLCCLHYEDEGYKECRKIMPKIDSYVNTKEGRGRVTQLNFVTQIARVDFDNGTTGYYHVSDMQFREKAIDENIEVNGGELKDLEG